MSHIPEDRHKHGLVLDYSLNLTKKTGAQWSKLAFGGTPAFSDSVIYHG